jgi:hypothetical protein
MARWSFLLALSCAGVAAARAEDEGSTAKPAPLVLAVIVHPKNPVTKVSFSELRSYLKVDREFWPNRKRCDVYLPQVSSNEYDVLLQKVYRMDNKKLQKYWVRRLFAGEISAKPSYVPSAKAAGEQVLKSEGAISVVAAHEVPEGVRVLLLDGKKPGDEGYPLVGVPRVEKNP